MDAKRRLEFLQKLANETAETPQDEIDQFDTFARGLRSAVDIYSRIGDRDKKLEFGRKLIKKIDDHYNQIREFVGGKVHEDYWSGTEGTVPSAPANKEPVKEPSAKDSIKPHKREKPKASSTPSKSSGEDAVSDVEMLMHSILDHAFAGKEIPDELVAKTPPKVLLTLQKAFKGDMNAITSLPQSIQHRMMQQAGAEGE